jgi:hypothetical protein
MSTMQQRRNHRLKTKEDLMKKLTPCGAKVHKCVLSKKKACRRRSREMLAKEMGMTRQELTKRYPKYDVHHEKRMSFKQEPGCKCSLACPVNETILVPSSWNRGAMKTFEFNEQKGYSFNDQMKGVHKCDGNKAKRPTPPSHSISLAAVSSKKNKLKKATKRGRGNA